MLLRKDDPWMLQLPVPDARGWPVVDTDGNFIGYVEELMVDMSEKKLQAVLTGPNERFAARDLDFGDGVITVRHSVQWRVRAREDEPAAFSSFDDAFSDHFRRVYPEAEHTLGRMAGAYRFGRRMAGDGDCVGLTFDEAEEGLRAKYIADGRTPSYGEAREAIRFAYNLTRGSESARVVAADGLDRVDRQVMNPKDEAPGRLATLGAAMAMGEP